MADHSEMAESLGASQVDALRDENAMISAVDSIASSRLVMGRKYSAHYKMDHPRRGTAIIFNHERFYNPELPIRTGTNQDAKTLKTAFESLGFDVTVHKDPILSDIEYVIEKTRKMDHSDADCLVIVVLTHGEVNLLHAKDTRYEPEKLWKSFTADNCTTLAGKPKLFFIQACQGDEKDEGATQTDGYSMERSYRIPKCADFLISCCTVPGFVAWREDEGSWFMQALCELLLSSGSKLDILTLLTLVTQKVAIDFESNCPSTLSYHRKKQIPSTITMLTRLLIFSPSRN